MQYQDLILKMKQFQNDLIDYLNGENDFEEISESFHDFRKYVNLREMEYIIRLIVKIANNHHRTPNFYEKIFKTLNLVKTEIEENFSKSEIFQLFESNKRILLFFIEESILEIDQSIFDQINHNSYWNMQYIKYFLPETKQFISKELYNEIRDQIKDDLNDIEIFKEKRRIGENDKYICGLIRNDSIDDFIVYMNRTNTPISSYITSSIYESNRFLIRSNPSLIEYAAFFGSFQIFKYLELNNAAFESSLWLYAIHGNNPEIIHILEDFHVKPSDSTFYECFVEAIKCHSNDIAIYIQNNLMNNYIMDFADYSIYFEFHNYFFFDNISMVKLLYYFVEYKYKYLILQIMKLNFDDINEMIIHKKNLFLIKFLFNLYYDVFKLFFFSYGIFNNYYFLNKISSFV